MKTITNITKRSLLLLACLFVVACSSTYMIETEPTGAQVSLKLKDNSVAIGQTPLDFSTAQLPEDQTFTLEFRKPGFETKTIDVMPIKQTRTTLNVQLETAADVRRELDLLHSRKLISNIFDIQEMVFRRKYVDALTELKELEKKESKLPELYVLKGSIYFLMSDFEEARNSWKQALKLDPALTNIRLRVAELEKKSGVRP